MKQFLLYALILLVSTAGAWADTDKETLVAITEASPTQYHMMVVQTVTTTRMENGTRKASTDSLTYPGVLAEVNGKEVLKELTDKDGNVALSASLRISKTDEGTIARYELKHMNNDGSQAVRSGELKLR